MHVYWEKDSSATKWPNRALTVARLHGASKRTEWWYCVAVSHILQTAIYKQCKM